MALFTIGDLIILGYKEERARDTLSTRESKLCNKNKKKIVISNSPFKKRGRKFYAMKQAYSMCFLCVVICFLKVQWPEGIE